MASVIPVIFVLVIVLGLMACGYLFVPKGQHQTYAFFNLSKPKLILPSNACRTIRTAIMLTLASCYLMWMVTYMAQLHPLISKSSNSSLWLYWLAHELQRHIVQRAERVYDGHALSEHCEQEIDLHFCRYDINRSGDDPPVPDSLD
jgi:V-type H+-transporting ATPase subunit e